MMRVASLAAAAFFFASCVDEVPLDKAGCPCLEGYYCTDNQICRPSKDVVSPLLGRKYIVEIDSAQWAEPPGFAESLDAADDYEGVYPVFAFEILSVDPRAMTFTALLGTVRDGVQDRGLRTYEMIGALDVVDEDTLAFTLGPADVQSIVFGPAPQPDESNRTIASYYGLTLTGRFLDRGTEIDNGILVAVLDAREIYTLFYIADTETGEELCNLLETDNVDLCLACPTSPDDDFCLTFRAEHLNFPNVPDLILNPVLGFDGKYV